MPSLPCRVLMFPPMQLPGTKANEKREPKLIAAKSCVVAKSSKSRIHTPGIPFPTSTIGSASFWCRGLGLLPLSDARDTKIKRDRCWQQSEGESCFDYGEGNIWMLVFFFFLGFISLFICVGWVMRWRGRYCSGEVWAGERERRRRKEGGKRVKDAWKRMKSWA